MGAVDGLDAEVIEEVGTQTIDVEAHGCSGGGRGVEEGGDARGAFAARCIADWRQGSVEAIVDGGACVFVIANGSPAEAEGVGVDDGGDEICNF